MRKQSQVMVGLVLVGVGLLLLFGAVFRVNVGVYCWPIGLIVAGGWLLLRPTLAGSSARVRVHPLADVRRAGAWDIVDEEIWIFVGDVRLDFTQVSLATGERTIKVFGLVGNVTLAIPEGLPVLVSSQAILTDGTVYGKKQEQFFSPVCVESEGYDAAAARLRVETWFVVNELGIKRSL